MHSESVSRCSGFNILSSHKKIIKKLSNRTHTWVFLKIIHKNGHLLKNDLWVVVIMVLPLHFRFLGLSTLTDRILGFCHYHHLQMAGFGLKSSYPRGLWVLVGVCSWTNVCLLSASVSGLSYYNQTNECQFISLCMYMPELWIYPLITQGGPQPLGVPRRTG